MNLPFSVEQFFQVFRDYNTAIWPFQILLYALGVSVIALIAKKRANRIVSAILAFLWAWMGIVYHIMFFARINPAAYGFGVLFLIQSFLIIWFGVRKENLCYSMGMQRRTALGSLLLLYAIVIYPALGSWLGHTYPYNPTFGVPCPTTIFTIGIFIFLDSPFPKRILIIPVLWCAVGSTAALSLGVKEDFGLVIAGLLALVKILPVNGRMKWVS